MSHGTASGVAAGRGGRRRDGLRRRGSGVGQVGCGTTSVRGSGAAAMARARGSGSAATGSGSASAAIGSGSGSASAATGSGAMTRRRRSGSGSGSTAALASRASAARSAASIASWLTGSAVGWRSSAGHAIASATSGSAASRLAAALLDGDSASATHRLGRPARRRPRRDRLGGDPAPRRDRLGRRPASATTASAALGDDRTGNRPRRTGARPRARPPRRDWHVGLDAASARWPRPRARGLGDDRRLDLGLDGLGDDRRLDLGLDGLGDDRRLDLGLDGLGDDAPRPGGSSGAPRARRLGLTGASTRLRLQLRAAATAAVAARLSRSSAARRASYAATASSRLWPGATPSTLLAVSSSS